MLLRLGACTLTVAAAWRLSAVPYAGPTMIHVAALLQLWLPLWRAEALGVSATKLGLLVEGSGQALWAAGLIALVTTPLWLCATWYVLTAQSAWSLVPGIVAAAARYAAEAGITALVSAVAMGILTQLMGIALIEEVFWRGYVQPVLEAKWPRPMGLGLCVGSVVATLLFAAVHLLEAGEPARLATFFPGLCFAFLRRRYVTLSGCIALHAWDNLIAQLVLQAAR